MRILNPNLAFRLSIIAAAVWLFLSLREIISYQGSTEVTVLLYAVAALGFILILLAGLFLRWFFERLVDIHRRARDNVIC